MWDNGLHHTHIWPQTMLALCATMVFTTQTSGHRQWWPYVRTVFTTQTSGHRQWWPYVRTVFTTQTSGHRRCPYVRQLSSPHRHLATDNDGLMWDNWLQHTDIWLQTMMALCETTVFTKQTSGHRQWWPYVRQLSSPHRHLATDNDGLMWDNGLHHTDIRPQTMMALMWCNGLHHTDIRPQTMMALCETTVFTTQTSDHRQW